MRLLTVLRLLKLLLVPNAVEAMGLGLGALRAGLRRLGIAVVDP